MTYACPTWEFAANTPSVQIAESVKQGSPHHWQFSKVHTLVRELHKAFSILYIYNYMTRLCRKQAQTIQNHGNANVRNIGQGEPRHRKFKRLKLGGCQA
jgi:hypothetical protein